MRQGKPCAPSDLKNAQNPTSNGHSGEADPLQELTWGPDEEAIELIDDDDIELIGDLGNPQDKALDIDSLLDELAKRPPTRTAYLVHRAVKCIEALKDLRRSPASAWHEDRVPEEHWRALADDALGLIGSAVRHEVEGRALVETLPENQRKSFQALLDSKLGMELFRKAFDQERAAWEKAYWLMAVDQSFGKRPWIGPQGWRGLLEPRYINPCMRDQ